MRALVPEQPVVHTDNTGWRVGGESAFLMAFVNPSLSVYQVRPQHRNEEVREMIGRSYDAVELAGVRQQKCLAHLIRNAAKVAADKSGRARQFGQQQKILRVGPEFLFTSPESISEKELHL